jgi:hypothetical protein
LQPQLDFSTAKGEIMRTPIKPALAGCILLSSAVWAADDLPDVDVGGFIRVDYGAGDRYPESRGEDRLGVSKAALAISAQQDDIKGVFVIGTEALTDGNPNNDGNVDIKDAFIVLGAGKQTGFWFSLGAQPLLFGLKPNGYPGDHSLQPSIEYGGAGGFAVSNQAGPSLIGTYGFTPSQSVRFGAFDLDRGNGQAPPTDGSNISDNLFIQWRGSQLGGTGLYATAGVEMLYVGGAVDDSAALFAAGLGYRQGPFDISLEATRLDSDIVGTADNELYLVAELAFKPNQDWTLYFDVANADELDANTYRLGADYRWRKHVTFSAEISEDDVAGNDVGSVDLRLTFSY